MSPQELQDIQNKVELIAREAGKIALDSLGRVKFEQKGNEGDLVTKTDREIEIFIKNKLEGLIEQASIYGEEYGGELSGEYVWLIDPIDGTKNFAHNMPSFFTHIILLENKEPVIGVIYDPVFKKLFSASKNNGAFLNGKKMIVNNFVKIEKAVVDIDFGGKEDLDYKTDVFKKIASKVYRARVSGGRLAPYLLTGGIDAFVVINPTTQLFDQAPRVILAQEAGYDVIDFDRKNWKVRIMTNPSLTQQLSEIIM